MLLTLLHTLLVMASTSFGPAHRHRLQPASGKVLHMAGQSPSEFGHYSNFLSFATRPLGYTSYLQVTELLEDSQKSARYFSEARATLDALGDKEHVVLPHVSLSLTPGGVVLSNINAGLYDNALAEFAAAVPLLGRPLFLRVGYEFNGHWNNYTALQFKKAWRRIEAVSQLIVCFDEYCTYKYT